MSAPAPQIVRLRQLMSKNEWGKALRLAASWPRLGKHKEAIERGWAAMSEPDFYREIGKDPARLVADGIAALNERYGGNCGN